MIFDPEILERAVNGDPTALTETVEFDDGTTKTLAACNIYDMGVMKAWLRYKAEEAKIRLEELPRHLTAV